MVLTDSTAQSNNIMMLIEVWIDVFGIRPLNSLIGVEILVPLLTTITLRRSPPGNGLNSLKATFPWKGPKLSS